MLMMVAGTKNGEILRGLIAFRYSLYSASMVPRPPMPAPQTAPQRVGSVLEKSRPESLTACTVLPTGDTTPRPVTTIRRLLIRYLYGALSNQDLLRRSLM